MSDGINRPRFQLEKVYADGSREEPELHSLDGIDANCRMGRRGFLLTSAIGVGALAALSTGCASGSAQSVSSDSAGPKAPANHPVSAPRISAPKIHGLTAHRNTVHSLVFSSDGKTLFTAGSDDKVKLWSVPEGKLQKTFGGGGWPKLVSIALDADDKTLVTGHFDGVLRLWRAPFVAKTDKEISSLKNITAIALGPDGKTLAVSTQKGIQFHSFPSGKALAALAQEHNVSRIAFSPDGAMLAGSVVETKETLLWSVPSGGLLARWNIFAESLVFNADGTVLAADRNSGVKELGRASSGNTEKVLKGKMPHTPLVFSPDGKWLAAKAGSGSVSLFAAPFSDLTLFILDHAGDIFTAAFSKDNRFLAVGTTTGAVYIWELAGEKMPCTLQAVLYDADSMPKNISARQAVTSEKSVYIGRCGDPLPAGAICTCNCVEGRAPVTGTICTCNTVVTCTCNTVPVRSTSPPRGMGGGGTYCRCNKICTCVPVK